MPPTKTRRHVHGKKIKTYVTLDPDLYDWMVDQTGLGKRFKDFTHGVETAIFEMRKKMEPETRKKAEK